MTRRNNILLKVALLSVAACLATQNFAISAAPTMQDKHQEVDAADVEKWIEQLSAESLIQRTEAREKLAAAGQVAVPALAKAALSEERDLIAHSIDILGDIAHKSMDAEAKEAAKITLEMLAESEQPSTAERAKLALDAEKGGGIQAFPGWDKPGSEFAGGGGGGMNRSVSVSSSNGMKTITVKENGITTTLQDLAGGKIRVHIDGGEQPREFTANNLDDLKKQDAGAFALYEQHGKGGFAGFPGFGGFGGLGLGGNDGQANTAKASDVNINVVGNGSDAAIKQLMLLQLMELRKRMEGNPEVQKLLDEQIEQLIGR